MFVIVGNLMLMIKEIDERGNGDKVMRVRWIYIW